MRGLCKIIEQLEEVLRKINSLDHSLPYPTAPQDSKQDVLPSNCL